MSSLYDDISLEDQVDNLRYKEMYEALKAEHEASLKELDDLKKQVASITEQNQTLERNVCCMYETAKREIERKDIIIADMRANK